MREISRVTGDAADRCCSRRGRTRTVADVAAGADGKRRSIGHRRRGGQLARSRRERCGRSAAPCPTAAPDRLLRHAALPARAARHRRSHRLRCRASRPHSGRLVGRSHPPDASAQYAVAWRPDGLYFFVRVHDPSLVPANPSEFSWEGDEVELYMDSDGDVRGGAHLRQPGRTTNHHRRSPGRAVVRRSRSLWYPGLVGTIDWTSTQFPPTASPMATSSRRSSPVRTSVCRRSRSPRADGWGSTSASACLTRPIKAQTPGPRGTVSASTSFESQTRTPEAAYHPSIRARSALRRCRRGERQRAARAPTLRPRAETTRSRVGSAVAKSVGDRRDAGGVIYGGYGGDRMGDSHEVQGA